MYYIGVDLGGTNIAVGIVNEKGEMLRKGSVPTNAKRPADEIIKDMGELCKKLVAEQGITVDDVQYAGIATPVLLTTTTVSLYMQTIFLLKTILSQQSFPSFQVSRRCL